MSQPSNAQNDPPLQQHIDPPNLPAVHPAVPIHNIDPQDLAAVHQPDSSFEISGRGEEKERQCYKEFRKLLRNTAITFMRRRTSSTLDESDISNAYSHLLSSHAKDWVKQILSAIVILAGGILITIGVRVTVNNSTPGEGILVILGGISYLLSDLFFNIIHSENNKSAPTNFENKYPRLKFFGCPSAHSGKHSTQSGRDSVPAGAGSGSDPRHRGRSYRVRGRG